MMLPVGIGSHSSGGIGQPRQGAVHACLQRGPFSKVHGMVYHEHLWEIGKRSETVRIFRSAAVVHHDHAFNATPQKIRNEHGKWWARLIGWNENRYCTGGYIAPLHLAAHSSAFSHE